MMTDRERQITIGLLLGAHLLLGLTMALVALSFSRLAYSTWTSIWYMGLISSDILLLGMWAGLSATRWWIKLAGLLGGITWLGCLSVAPLPLSVEFTPILALVAVPVLVIAGTCAGCRRLLARVECRTRWESRPISEELQFTLKTMIGLTITIAALLAVGRFVREIDPVTQQPSYRFAIVVFALSLTALLAAGMIAWASLGPGQAIVRVPTALVGTTVLGLLSPYYMHGPAHLYLIWPALTALVALSTVASLMVIRACGYRLVSIRDEFHATTSRIATDEFPESR